MRSPSIRPRIIPSQASGIKQNTQEEAGTCELAMVRPDRAGVSQKQSSALALGDMLKDFELQDKGGYITQEFQDYGYRLAVELDDMPHKSLYIKMAKEQPRGLLEQALSYVKDANAVKSKAKLFMWRLQQLVKESAAKKQNKAKSAVQTSLFSND